eukprot:scaffold76419_cov27-Tisochrysis_lutea.AAC.3
MAHRGHSAYGAAYGGRFPREGLARRLRGPERLGAIVYGRIILVGHPLCESYQQAELLGSLPWAVRKALADIAIGAPAEAQHALANEALTGAPHARGGGHGREAVSSSEALTHNRRLIAARVLGETVASLGRRQGEDAVRDGPQPGRRLRLTSRSVCLGAHLKGLTRAIV